jgi:hypothetical protein
MDRPLLQMTLAEYAELQTRFGAKILCRNGRFWREVRPFFFRPLLPVEAYEASAIQRPVAWPSGFQYVVTPGARTNSTMNFVMADSPQGYSLDTLSHKRRQLIKRAARDFEVRPLRDPGELKRLGHKVYLSFYGRTRYPYKSDRQDKAVFDRWVDTLFSTPKPILLGGFGRDGLGAISTSYWINHTWVYSTLICETAALKKNLGELMFHEIRQLAARESLIKEIFVRPYQGGNSLDDYYLLRGCRLARMPARLELSSPILSVIRWALPRQYELLLGED